jgi:hypothetical protein
MSDQSDRAASISALNDELRRFGRGGRVMITSGIEALGAAAITRILAAVASFNAFTGDNDPYSEHDCAILTGLIPLSQGDLNMVFCHG